MGELWALACCIKRMLQVELRGSSCSAWWLMAHRSQAEQFCCCPAGPVSKIRLLGDYHHATRIAFIEFDKAESAKVALNCSGALLGAPGCPQHCIWLAAGSSACRHVLAQLQLCLVVAAARACLPAPG